MFRSALLLLLVGPILVALSEPPEKISEPSSEMEVAFLNGSNVRVAFLAPSLQVVTRYGRLEVPFSEIKSIEVGLHLPPALEARVNAAIEELGNNEFSRREAACKALLELGHYSHPALLKATQSTDLERKRLALDVLEKMRAKVPEKLLKLPAEDRLVTQKFTILGKIDNHTFKVRTEYFGDVDIQLHQILRIQSVFAPVALLVNVEAEKYAVPGAWMETEIDIAEGKKLTITAEGNVDQWPATPGQYMVTPRGHQDRRGNATDHKNINPNNLQTYSGALLGRIGKNGPIYLIGDSNTSTATQSGRLQLCIAPSHWGNPDCTGTYKVKVTVSE